MSNDWQKQFGARRRELDRAILREAERAIGLEEVAGAQTAKNGPRPSAVNSVAPDIDFNDAERKRIAKAFGRPVT